MALPGADGHVTDPEGRLTSPRGVRAVPLVKRAAATGDRGPHQDGRATSPSWQRVPTTSGVRPPRARAQPPRELAPTRACGDVGPRDASRLPPCSGRLASERRGRSTLGRSVPTSLHACRAPSTRGDALTTARVRAAAMGYPSRNGGSGPRAPRVSACGWEVRQKVRRGRPPSRRARPLRARGVVVPQGCKLRWRLSGGAGSCPLSTS
jgi:hypothetical protein